MGERHVVVQRHAQKCRAVEFTMAEDAVAYLHVLECRAVEIAVIEEHVHELTIRFQGKVELSTPFEADIRQFDGGIVRNIVGHPVSKRWTVCYSDTKGLASSLVFGSVVVVMKVWLALLSLPMADLW